MSEKNAIQEMGDKFIAFLKSDSPEQKETETKTEEVKEEVKMELNAPDGVYTGEAGTIEISDNSVTFTAGEAEEETEATEDTAEAELSGTKKEKTEMSEDKPNELLDEVKALRTDLAEAQKATPISSAPKKGTPVEPIQLTSDMTSEDKQAARRHNRNLNKR